MNRNTKIGAGIAAGATAVAAAAVIALASPATSAVRTADETPSPSSTSSPDSSTATDRGRGGAGETLLTGDDASRAAAAAQAAVEGGTIIRVETDSEGTYEAHMRKADGTEVVVKMDADLTVTSVDEFAGGRGGHRGRGGPGAGETPLTGDDATKATAAAEAAVEGGTIIRVETDADGTYEAHVRKADGTEVEVKMDADFTVTSVDEFTGRGGHGGDGPDSDASGSASDDAAASATPSA